jgi:hypothetical protein
VHIWTKGAPDDDPNPVVRRLPFFRRHVMSQTKDTVSSRGVRAPDHLVEWVRTEIDRCGDAALARRIGLTRTPVLRVAAGLTVFPGTVSMVREDYDLHHRKAA